MAGHGRPRSPQCPEHQVSARKAYDEIGCRCSVCSGFKAETRSRPADAGAEAGPVEQGVRDDAAAARLTQNPRRAQLLATALHLARLIDQGKVSSVAAAVRELNSTTDALHHAGNGLGDDLDEAVEAYGRPTLVPASGGD